MSFCLLRHVGVECFGMKQDFGWDRYHNSKREVVGQKIAELEKTPILLATAATFHPVPPEFQERLRDSIAKARTLYYITLYHITLCHITL